MNDREIIALLLSFRLEKMGALDVTKVVHQHEGWRLITCMWLHGGVFHLLANMLSLLVIGIRLEREFGYGTLQPLHNHVRTLVHDVVERAIAS